MSALTTILSALNGEPRTLPELSAELGSSPTAIQGMMQTLMGNGYIQDATPGQGGCACTGCSLKSMCRNADGSDLPPMNLLRLTPRGQKYLAKRK